MNNGFLQDAKGNNSSTRLMGAFVWTLVMGMWAFITIKTGVMQELPQTIIIVLGTAAGWLLFNKQIESNVPKATV